MAACNPLRESIYGVPLDKDLMAGNLNFWKASEGYFEAYPQAVYQLSITMRDVWPPSKNISNIEYRIVHHYFTVFNVFAIFL